MQTRSGKVLPVPKCPTNAQMQLRSANVWPTVQNTMGQCRTWEETLLQLRDLNVGAWERDLLYQRTAFIKSCYVMLNNKRFWKKIDYRRVVTTMVVKFNGPLDPPKYVKKLFHQVRLLTPQGIARQRWGVLRASMKFLSLHSRAVITANHPSRIDFTIKED